jgi:competence ComEA-like helix-hairpin-helix protein
MTLSDADRRALAVILGLLVLASAARWLERPRPLLEELPALDTEALEAASRSARPAGAAGLRAGERIDPNSASLDELQRLPGVGPVTAQRIIEERERAPFRSVAELQRVRGIGPAAVARLGPHVALPETVRATSPPPATLSLPAARGAAGAGRLDLNRATAAELQEVPGIGPVLAGRILLRRDSLGGFRDWADVDAVPGVGPALLARLQALALLGRRMP